ncbi:MAG: cyclic nucleotide-binding domain-containing protein [Nitrospirae bacterium]|nr:cyclic nucleotide-binding domain-containing protein [Nitrospirota bacterium]
MDKEQVKKILNELREEIIFSLLDDEDVEKIAPYFELNTYSEGDVVFKEGDPGDFIGLVISGKLEVKKQTEFKGKQVIIALLTKGALVGELSIFDRHKRSATVEAVEKTTMLILMNDKLDTLMQEHPCTGIKILKGLLRILSLRLRKATERLTHIF